MFVFALEVCETKCGGQWQLISIDCEILGCVSLWYVMIILEIL
jgi:hypothetical protein